MGMEGTEDRSSGVQTKNTEFRIQESEGFAGNADPDPDTDS
jgi:hypothetical protein